MTTQINTEELSFETVPSDQVKRYDRKSDVPEPLRVLVNTQVELTSTSGVDGDWIALPDVDAKATQKLLRQARELARGAGRTITAGYRTSDRRRTFRINAHASRETVQDDTEPAGEPEPTSAAPKGRRGR